MTNKEILREIVLEDGIENISFNENSFIIFFGDVLNTDIHGEEYKLLQTYVEIPYSFEPSNFKLHRGIVDALECNNIYEYSGFVHYSGTNFCYGQSNVDRTANIIRSEGLTSDLFTRLIMEFTNYLSNSSHGTTGHWRRINLSGQETSNYSIRDYVNCNGIYYPRLLNLTTNNRVISRVKYEEPYTLLKEVPNKAFVYNNETIIPKIVKHELEYEEREVITPIAINLDELEQQIKQTLIQNFTNEIDNTTPFSSENFLHELAISQHRVDGSFYI